MWNMILKDIIFHKKTVISSILLVLISFVSSMRNITSGLYIGYIGMLLPLLLIITLIHPICIEEEKQGILNFLKTLPIKKSHVVLAKFLFSLACSLLGYCILIANILVVNSSMLYIILSKYLSISFGVNLLFISLFLAAYYRFGSSLAHYSLFIVPIFFGIFALTKKYSSYIKELINIDIQLLFDILLENIAYMSIGLLLLGLISIIISYKFSVKSYISRYY